jgi:predicted ester cyclase
MTAQNMTISRNYLDGVWNKRDLSVIDKLIAPDIVQNGPMTERFSQGQAGIREFVGAFLKGMPDVKCTIDRQEDEGDLVRNWVTFSGTQTGMLMTIPPTGKKFSVPVLITDRIYGGQIVETWGEWDPNELLRQLGVA